MKILTLLSEGFEKLVNLKKLDISWTKIVALPEGIMHQTIHHIQLIEATSQTNV